MNQRLEVRQEQGVAWLTFHREASLNAFTGGDYRDVRQALEVAMADSAVRVIVLTGSGRAFSVGADRSLLDGSASPEDRDLAGPEFEAMLEVLAKCEKPVLAAVNGLAVGVGVTLLLYVDLVLAASSARFRLPFTELGIVPEAGSSVLLWERCAAGQATWALLSSEWFDAETAVAMGLVWQVVPDDTLLSATSAVASTLARHDPASIAATKRLMTAGRADRARSARARELVEFRRLLGP